MTKNKKNTRHIVTKKSRIGKVTKTVLLYAMLAVSALIYTATVFKQKEFGESKIEEILFLIFNGFAGGNTTDTMSMVYDNLILFIIVLFLLLLPVVDFYRNRIFIEFNLSIFGKNKTISFNPSKIPWWTKFTYAGVVLVSTLWFLLVSFQVPAYIKSLSETSQIFEENYVDPSKVAFEFPEKKKNLVFIYLESMENTLASKKAGGQKDQSLIPELENLALDKDSVSFSHNMKGLGGAQRVTGTTWTVASMTSQSLGVPIKPNFTGIDGNEYGKLDKFFPGTYGIGEVLKSEGYNLSFLMGSNQAFGGRDKLLAQHGGYNVIDHENAIATGRLPKDYNVWWGYEDKKLFAYAKEEATRLAAKNAPFNLSLLTADTHFVDGYLDPSCPTPYEKQYDNVYACSSAQVAAFISWIREQPFAENTTIIVVGDHIGMQHAYYDEMITSPAYLRTTYNLILNSSIKQTEPKPRLFAAFDMYPTTLAALGVKIPGDQLGIGTNLFASDKMTLLEKYGSVESLNNELVKRNNLYNKTILTESKK